MIFSMGKRFSQFLSIGLSYCTNSILCIDVNYSHWCNQGCCSREVRGTEGWTWATIVLKTSKNVNAIFISCNMVSMMRCLFTLTVEPLARLAITTRDRQGCRRRVFTIAISFGFGGRWYLSPKTIFTKFLSVEPTFMLVVVVLAGRLEREDWAPSGIGGRSPGTTMGTGDKRSGRDKRLVPGACCYSVVEAIIS